MAGSYFFDAVAGETPEDVKRKRAIVEALMGQAGPARNVGEGVHSLFSGIAAGIMRNRANKAETAGREKGDAAFKGMFAGFPAAPGQPASVGSAVAPDYPSQRVAQAFGDDPGYRDAIASIESKGSGDYGAVGPTHPKMGRALGRYQIMESNIGPWSMEALGREVTPDEFMSDPKIQDAIFDKKFQGYVAKYGPEGAAQAWFGGPGGVGKTDRKDVLGTSIGGYGKKFMGNLGQDAVQGSVGADPIAAVNVPPTDAGLQSPGAQRIVQSLLSPQPMGGPPQQMQAPRQVSQAQGAPEMAGNAMSDASGPDINQLLQAAANPWMSEGQKAVVNSLLEQKMREQQQVQTRQQEMADPRTQLDMDLKRAQIAKMQQEGNGSDETFFGNPIAIKNADGSVSYGQLGNKGTFRPVNLGEGQSFAPPTKQIDTGVEIIHVDQAGNVISRVPKQNFQEAQEKAAGAGAGKSAAEVQSEYNSISSKMPGLRGVIDNLGKLADKATYTTAGQLIDWGMKEAGMEPREAAVARAEYTAIVDNQILPLLRDTFGAQFTAAEGEKLSRTLGDPNMSPTEKHAILKAFIEQKERDVAALQSRIGGQQDPATAPAAAPASDDPLGLF